MGQAIGAELKEFLTVDNLKAYHTKKVTAWAKSYAFEIELFYRSK
ncbi:MAG: hypothetical protein ACR2Q4_09065 [Geminicoccaceae bacterium]